MKLHLTRPLVFFDLETTGTNVNTDRIVEISLIKLLPDGSHIEKTRRINPEMPIPAEATAVHHITDEMVAGEKTFKQIAASLAQILAGCDIAGFNSNRFDIPLLDQEFCRANVDFDFSKARFIDVQTIYHKKEPRTLSAAYKYYCGEELVGAHGAAADTEATMKVLLAQLEKYDDLPAEVGALSEFASNNRNVDFMGRLIFDEQGREVINFGKYKGRIAEEVLVQDPGYYSWIMNGDFAQNTKRAFTRIRLRNKKK
ncbi:MAG: 3'-5' exonuclease [Muribaculaceae bacterium]|nr:3'-5' exonuclease [Muribaculaceae bacterium]